MRLGVLSLSGAAGGGAAPDRSDAAAGDRNRIAEAIDAFVAAYNAGDAARIIAYYADDLIKERQGAAAETKTQTARRIEQVFREHRGELSVSNEEIVTSGDLAYTRGTLRLTLTPRAGGPPRTLERRFLEIWRKRQGEWRVVRTMDNSPAPDD
ncbi:MAG: YybH family protein [Acidobacteriota bacterium]